ncbi:HNH endonuclease [Streptomyces sp. SPB162]|uniref:HNH endonuclease n=1 Tax=Streptomyces sp. SPB162 TaxID=2940560 RepID=UPI00240719C9|nr:HNH endonuclease [Streptomyces sp. SPB162]MDF9815961.1 putative restriction endonuclease [Streptomyces sp. SPB162]
MSTVLSDADSVLKAVEEFKASGRDSFLKEHGFSRARQYYLQLDGRLYDAKAIANVAFGGGHQRDVAAAQVISGGRARSNKMLSDLGFTIVDGRPTTVEGELAWRLAVWKHLQETEEDLTRVSPSAYRAFDAFAGGQGIWVDSKRTSLLRKGGITVGVMHSGEHYPDDLSEDGALYQYPLTRRPAGRDDSEIAATKAAAELELPIFVIAKPTPQSNVRIVQLAWVEGWQDESRTFLLTYGQSPPQQILRADHSDEVPFTLTGSRSRQARRNVRVRPGQARFKLQVFQRYFPRCPLSGIAVPEMLEAAHLRPVAQDGTDDPRNGLPLNAALHRAFDAHLFGIEPHTLSVIPRPQGPTLEELGITTPHLRDLPHPPRQEALEWRYADWLERMRLKDQPLL